MDISNSIYGKKFADFISNIDSASKLRSFNQLENDFLELLDSLGKDEKINCINGWRDYIQKMITNYNPSSNKDSNFFHKRGYDFFINYQEMIINDNYFKPEYRNHPVLGDGFQLLKSCISAIASKRKLNKADFSFLWHKLKRELNCNGEEYMNWVNLEYPFKIKYNRIKSLNDINPSR